VSYPVAVVLVLGMLPAPVGKTQVAQGLVRGLAEVGFKAAHVKPTALLDARVLVVEGFSDGARPLGSLGVRPAAVLAVAPGQVVAYDPAKFAAVVGASAGARGSVRLEDVAGFIHPEAYFRLPMPGLGGGEAREGAADALMGYVLAKLEL
jgi:predicted P-loop ATPase/GTPase